MQDRDDDVFPVASVTFYLLIRSWCREREEEEPTSENPTVLGWEEEEQPFAVLESQPDTAGIPDLLSNLHTMMSRHVLHWKSYN